MSNGEDVLDNWEEIDDAGISKSLSKIKDARKKAINTNMTKSPTPDVKDNEDSRQKEIKLLQRTQKLDDNSDNLTVATKSPLDDLSEKLQPVMMVLHKTDDEYQSANYAQATNTQTVKILRRPTQANDSRKNGIKPRQPIKSLQQREQEYAEARLRILGSAKNPDDDHIESVAGNNVNTTINAIISTNTTNTNTNCINTNSNLNVNVNNVSNTSATSSSSSTSSTGSSSANSPPYRIQSSPKAHGIHNTFQNHFSNKHQHNTHMPAQQHHPGKYHYFQSPQLHQPLQQTQHLQQSKYQQHHQQHQQQHSQQLSHQLRHIWTPIAGGNASAPGLRHNDAILRLPRGPDGSSGFHMRR